MLFLTLTLSLGLAGQPGCSPIPDTAHIEFVGRFSNMRYTEEHAYGHTVELWRAGRCVFGLFENSEGLAGDTPAGLLSDVHYSPGGAVSFSVKLTTGMTTVAGSDTMVPSRDLFIFSGKMGKTALEGRLRRLNELRRDIQPLDSHTLMRRVPAEDGSRSDAGTYGVWREAVEPILRFRGPRW
jgi:hypothetical protein